MSQGSGWMLSIVGGALAAGAVVYGWYVQTQAEGWFFQ